MQTWFITRHSYRCNSLLLRILSLRLWISFPLTRLCWRTWSSISSHQLWLLSSIRYAIPLYFTSSNKLNRIILIVFCLITLRGLLTLVINLGLPVFHTELIRLKWGRIRFKQCLKSWLLLHNLECSCRSILGCMAWTRRSLQVRPSLQLQHNHLLPRLLRHQLYKQSTHQTYQVNLISLPVIRPLRV